MRQKSNNVNASDPVQFWLLVAASCLALIALALTFPVWTVQADAFVSRPTAVSPAASPVTRPTPKLVEDVEAERRTPASLLHGVASWYGSVFNGRQTASGEKFDMNAMTACHPTLPFGTQIKVVNLRNRKSVVVRVTDRGYLLEGRMLDLSYGAAKQLGMVDAGLARVKVEILKMGTPQTN
jgi:rare lipoprotein A